MFGLRETERKERGRRERLKNIPLSFVWFIIKKGRKESFLVGPTKKTIPPKLDGKGMKACFLCEMTHIPKYIKIIATIFMLVFYLFF
jgi:vacuolar-type H+-ATPase subunit I/STV1